MRNFTGMAWRLLADLILLLYGMSVLIVVLRLLVLVVNGWVYWRVLRRRMAATQGPS